MNLGTFIMTEKEISTIDINFARSTQAILRQPFLTDYLKLFRAVYCFILVRTIFYTSGCKMEILQYTV